jgi:hypothetical protein
MTKADENIKITISEIVDNLDVDVGILITVDKDGISMCAAATSIESEVVSSQMMSMISEVLFPKKTLAAMRPANKIPA